MHKTFTGRLTESLMCLVHNCFFFYRNQTNRCFRLTSAVSCVTGCVLLNLFFLFFIFGLVAPPPFFFLGDVIN
jgi:hypothetical protein